LGLRRASRLGLRKLERLRLGLRKVLRQPHRQRRVVWRMRLRVLPPKVLLHK
jgi:hypothetical protein